MHKLLVGFNMWCHPTIDYMLHHAKWIESMNRTLFIIKAKKQEIFHALISALAWLIARIMAVQKTLWSIVAVVVPVKECSGCRLALNGYLPFTIINCLTVSHTRVQKCTVHFWVKYWYSCLFEFLHGWELLLLL